jgi:hypothetical protein
MLVNRPSRLAFLFTAKVGSTLATSLMFKHAGVYETVREWTHHSHHAPFMAPIHQYRESVFDTQSDHEAVDCAVCEMPEWTCLKMVRNPLNRAVSSYITTGEVMRLEASTGYKAYAMRHGFESKQTLPELVALEGKARTRFSFADFLDALEIRAQGCDRSFMDVHFMPQDSLPCSPVGRIRHIPIEAMSLGALNAATNGTGVVFNDIPQSPELVNSVHAIPHAVTGQNTLSGDPSRWSFQTVYQQFNNYRVHPPSYDAFLSGEGITSRICRLFRADVMLYRRMCEQPWLHACTACVAVCQAQIAKLRVCTDEDRHMHWWNQLRNVCSSSSPQGYSVQLPP